MLQDFERRDKSGVLSGTARRKVGHRAQVDIVIAFATVVDCLGVEVKATGLESCQTRLIQKESRTAADVHHLAEIVDKGISYGAIKGWAGLGVVVGKLSLEICVKTGVP